MERALYVVAREQPLLVGYLRTRVGARVPPGRVVEIKLDERQGERRQSSAAHDPERRRGERRVRPSLDEDLRARGYAVVSSEADSARAEELAPAPAWRRRSSWAHRLGRAGRRRWVRRGLLGVLLAGIGASIVLAQSMHGTSDAPPPAPQVPPRTEETSPSRPPAKVETVAPAVPPPSAKPAPARIVSTRVSGVVLSIEPSAGMLVLEDGGAAGRLRVELAPDARVVLSERDEHAEDPSQPFKDTVIDLADVRRGDYVVVERRGPEGKELARSVVVTFRPQ